MKKLLIILILIGISQSGFSQVGINTTSPNAQFDVRSSNQLTPANTDGILIPKIDAFPAINPTAAQNSMLVYLTTTSAGKSPGFYYWDNNGTPQWRGFGGTIPNGTAIGNTMYWDGTTWVNNSGFLFNNGTSVGVNTAAPSSVLTVKKDAIGFTQEDTTGNSKIGFYTVNGNAWLQTHSNTDLSFATNNGATQMVLKTATGNLGINTLSPSEKLEVAGKTKTDNLQVVTGAGAGKILISDAVGNATWQAPAAFTGWSITGNSGTSPATNFIGTTDNNDLVFKRFNIVSGKIGTTNTSFGVNTLPLSATGTNNTAIGTSALHGSAIPADNTGDSNTAIGYQALLNNSYGSQNTATGVTALYSNATANFNTAYGYATLYSNTGGSNNTANGYKSLYSNIFGRSNTANGDSSLYSNTEGDYNVAYGTQSLFYNATGSNATAIGTRAMFYANNTTTPYVNQNIAIGFEALRGSTTPANNTGYSNVAIGYQSLLNNSTGSGNSAVGDRTLSSNTSGGYNNAFGYLSLTSNTTGIQNNAHGSEVLFGNTTGSYNSGFGYRALNSNNGNYNSAFGNGSLLLNSMASNNVGMGYRALGSQIFSNGGVAYDTNNVAVGVDALFSNNPTTATNGIGNTAIGNTSLNSNTTGRYNTAVGYRTLLVNTTGDFNTTLGYNAYPTTNNLSNYTAIGYNVGSGSSTSNMVEIGNTFVTSIRGQVTFTTYSDKRIKKNIQNNVPGLSFINKLRPVTYNLDIHKQNAILYKDKKDTDADWDGKYDIENTTQTGFIAQEVVQAAKESSFDFSGIDAPKSNDGLYGLRYAEFVVPLVKAVQEQQEIIENQNKKIELLEKTNEEILKRLENLEKQ